LNRKGLTLASPTLRRPPVYRRRRERKPRTVCSRDCNERRSGPPGDPGAPLGKLLWRGERANIARPAPTAESPLPTSPETKAGTGDASAWGARDEPSVGDCDQARQ
jgi:hypothetical protein